MKYEAGCESSLEEEFEPRLRNEMKNFRDCSVAARSLQTLEQGNVGSKYPLNSLQQILVSSLCFTQTSIAVHFSGAHQKSRIDDTVVMILNSKLRPESLPRLEVMEYKGFLWSFNNRRLWVFKKAKVNVVTVLIVSPNQHKNRFRTFLEELQGQPELFSKLTRKGFWPRVRGDHKTNFPLPESAQTEKLGGGNKRKRIRCVSQCERVDRMPFGERTASTPLLETVTKVHLRSERKQAWSVRQQEGENRGTKKSSPPSENPAKVGNSSAGKHISTPLLQNVTEVVAGSKGKQIRNKTSSESFEEAVNNTGAGSEEQTRGTTQPKLECKAIAKEWRVITKPEAGASKEQIKGARSSSTFCEDAICPEPSIGGRAPWVAGNLPTSNETCSEVEGDSKPLLESRTCGSATNPGALHEDAVRRTHPSRKRSIPEGPCWNPNSAPTIEEEEQLDSYFEPEATGCGVYYLLTRMKNWVWGSCCSFTAV